MVRDYTTNLNLVLPKADDQYNIKDFNDNAQKIDNFAGLTPPKALTADSLTNSVNINGVPFKGNSNVITGLGLYSKTETYNNTNIAYNIQDDGIKLYKSLQNNNVGHELSETEWWKEISLGGSGLEVCDIGTALYIDETKGLRRRLNGQIVDANANTQGFIDKLVNIKVLAPSLFCTEEEWQAIKSASKLGQCGKFVFNYSGVEIVSVRIPAVVNINGLVDMANCGLIKNETLPNITGYIDAFVGTTKNTGVFSQNKRTTNAQGSASQKTGVDFNASGSSSTYQNNAPVQQEAIQYPYFIQIATDQETENNIINDIELNNPYVLFTSHYVEAPLYNLSWLKSDGEYKPKARYPKAYEALAVEQNADIAVGTTVDLPSGTKYTKRGLSVKLSTASDITDYDFVVNTTDETFRLPLKNGMEGIFASGVKGNGITLGLTDGKNNYGLANGTYNLGAMANAYGAPASASANPGTALGTQKYSFGITTDPTKSGMVVDTAVPAGYNLYYYVGETVQNANLIDAGRVGEELTNKLNKSDVKAYIIQTYVNGTSWYRIWSDDYCEQGGRLYNAKDVANTITLLKTMKNTNYSVFIAHGVKGVYDDTANMKRAEEPFNFTVTSFQVYTHPSDGLNTVQWKVCGYIAEGEY